MSTTTAELEHIVQEAEELFAPCVLCEHRCGAMRVDGEKGLCDLADLTQVYNRMLHVGEEASLVPSYAIFLNACNFRCSFCSEFAHLPAPHRGRKVEAESFAKKAADEITRYRKRYGSVQNINFVGGEPSLHLPFIARFVLEIRKHLDDVPPILLNTNGYLSEEAMELALGFCDIFIIDHKFGKDRCAQEVAGVPGYLEVIRRNLARLYRASKDTGTEVWVRHLLMPGHLECCTATCLHDLEMYETFHVNIMPQFFPFQGGDNIKWPHLSDADKARGRALLMQSRITQKYFDGRSAT